MWAESIPLSVLTFLSEGLVSSDLDSAEQLSSLHTGDKIVSLENQSHNKASQLQYDRETSQLWNRLKQVIRWYNHRH